MPFELDLANRFRFQSMTDKRPQGTFNDRPQGVRLNQCNEVELRFGDWFDSSSSRCQPDAVALTLIENNPDQTLQH